VTARAVPNPEQQNVVGAPLAGPHLVRAGAGTGKTFTLVERALALTGGSAASGAVRPSELLVVTFTNQAASEIADRLTKAFRARGIDEAPVCSTFHSLGSSILREFAVESGLSPDVRAVPNPRARIIFRRAYEELLRGRLAADVSALPILDRNADLELSLAQIALHFRDRGITVDEFEARAVAAAGALRRQTWGQLWRPAKKRNAAQRAEALPKVERTAEERLAEAEREECNVHATAALFRRFYALLREEALATFGDLLVQAARLVRNEPGIAAVLRARWKHALVDEFQDTNPMQIELLRAIFGDGLVPVMAVGDAKQAIYAFNGADPEGIERFAELPGCIAYPLVENRRSVQQILNAAHAFLASQSDEVEEGSKSLPLVAIKGAAAEFPLRVQAFGTGDLDEGRRLEAEAIAAEVERLLAGGAQAREIAILLRGWRRARIYVDALHARGIAAKTHGGVGFLDAPEIRDAIAWLNLILDPADAAATVRVLQSPSCGLSDGTLVALAHGAVGLEREAWSEPLPSRLDAAERSRLQRARSVLRSLGHVVTLPLSHAIAEIVRATGIDLAYAVADPHGAEQTRANLAKLVRLASAFERDRPTARASDFIAEIDERREFDDDEREADFGDDEVAIMTVHAAKGLEWEYVFIANVSPASFPGHGGGLAPCAAWDERSGALALRYGIDGLTPLRWTMRTPHDPATGERSARADANAEEARLCYVAMTRAKARLYMSGANGKESKAASGGTGGVTYATSQYLKAVRDWALGQGVSDEQLGFGAGGGEPSAAAQGRAEERALERKDAAREGLHRMLERARSAASASVVLPARVLSYTAIGTYGECPRLARYRYLLRLPDLREESATPLWTAEGSDPLAEKLQPATFGSIVHRALELAARARIAGTNAEIEAYVTQAFSEEEREGNPAALERALATVRHGIEKLAPYTPREPELRFDTTIAGIRVGGFIDLLADDPEGRPVVIDYKTGNVADESYRIQLSLYQRVLRDRFSVPLRTAILRLGPDEARFVDLPPIGDAALDAKVQAASHLDDDTPTTGPHCRSCPYAGSLCREGAAYIATPA
jgi:superfamily I DNA/RNA helicase/RecB family exonuclease